MSSYKVLVSSRAIEWLEHLEDQGRNPEGLKCSSIRGSSIPLIMRGDEDVVKFDSRAEEPVHALLEASKCGKAERLTNKLGKVQFEGRSLRNLIKV